ncbi:MAG: Dyp-type peroxidase [Sulfuritalea sp.]|nr:Dyp-type peroxidase [Sulfuritalea sp.]MCF8184608.1 Dyp-type peroxidase [Polynucleobacter sp.]
MTHVQAGISAPLPIFARYLFLLAIPGADVPGALRALAELADGERAVVGLGHSLVQSLDREVEGLKGFPSYAAARIEVASTPTDLWCWLRGDDRGELMHRARQIEKAVSGAFRLQQTIDGFQYQSGRDLTGYEDGTENPQGEAALVAAVVQGQGSGLDGGSFVAVQQWLHDFDSFEAMTTTEQDNSIGRRRSDNEEIDEAPLSAHVKRTAQESFEPEAFVLRRSMPWAEGAAAGLVFVAFGKSFVAFEALLQRMVGAEDGVTDALFRYTRPVSGAYFWCPPMKAGRLDLSVLGIP